MKKIGLINFHCANNYGALLQCFALSEYIKKLGMDVEVINYCPRSVAYVYRRWKNPLTYVNVYLRKKGKVNFINICKSCCHFVRVLLCDLRDVVDYRKKLKIDRFEKFRKEKLKMTSPFYTYESLCKESFAYDICIAGSDQIWNKENTDDRFDFSYFLEFVGSGCIKVAYGASIGIEPESSYILELETHLKKLDFISVREKSLMKALNSKMGLNVKYVCDPVFLLSKEKWNIIIPENYSKTEKYILVYSFEKSIELFELIEKIQSETGLKVIDISHESLGYTNTWIDDRGCGPIEFLSYIKSADIIITNSFHGVAFSLIFEKTFISFVRKDTGSRITDLLTKLELQKCIYKKDKPWYDYCAEIEYDRVNKRLGDFIRSSEEFIRNFLTCKI